MADKQPPGGAWRILAWNHRGNESFDVHSADLPPDVKANDTTVLESRTTLDEVVMLWPRVHIEQISNTSWVADLGGYRFWLYAEGGGKTRVQHEGKELGEYGLEKD